MKMPIPTHGGGGVQRQLRVCGIVNISHTFKVVACLEPRIIDKELRDNTRLRISTAHIASTITSHSLELL